MEIRNAFSNHVIDFTNWKFDVEAGFEDDSCIKVNTREIKFNGSVTTSTDKLICRSFY